ncbi:uncharacterized protein LAESUDRAFT_119137 [Laetiporus sulphureus 93-53]|uniref:F-box domain-containing protein n=1 Tax=Laetiporus sulphureus 93-53 TaxID=1314785 RepID=A0A165EJU1_9APHY|nr:uncharacterized protein LAESUDRAFT_119137 [Laetiporus sulphureus 93-53]KZT07201.1 hypothetical protein LAESUDRAFT_119137 [Laetiporus sulphureus 93-53]
MADYIQGLNVYAADPPYAHVIPHLLGGAFPNLTSIAFHNVRWSGQHAGIYHSFVSLMPRFKTVTTLRLSSCKFNNMSDLFRLLRSLPRLKFLALCAVSWHNSASQCIQTWHDGPKLQSLIMWDMSINDVQRICEWLAQSSGRQHICSLILGRLDHKGWQNNFGRLLESIGPSLQNLSLPLVLRNDGCSWTNNPNLRSLVIYCCRVHDWSAACDDTGWLIGQIVNGRVCEVAFEFLVSPEQVAADMVDIRAINGVGACSGGRTDHCPLQQSNHIDERELPFATTLRIVGDANVGGANAGDDAMRFFRIIEEELQRQGWRARGLIRTSTCPRQISFCLRFTKT